MQSNKQGQLYVSLTSPYARKVRIAAIEKQVPFEMIVEVPWNEGTMITNINPLGKVPVWILANGKALFDSRVIVEYLDGVSTTGNLMPVDLLERIEVKRWEALAEGVMDAALVIFAERKKRPIELQYPNWIARQFGKIHRGLKTLSDELSDREFYFGDKLSIADIAVASALGYIGLRFNDDFNWQQEYPVLAEHYRRLMQRHSFKSTVPIV
ncbi:MAG: glutathione S-transferase C-terminal domain-containing protein [Pseudomonadota bacterium]